MATTLRLGVDGKLYRDTSGSAWSGTFSEVKNVHDSLSIELSMDMGDSTRRGFGPVKTQEAVLLGVQLKWKMVEDLGDSNFLAFRTAFFTRALVTLLTSSAAYTNSGETYLRGDYKISGFTKSEPVNNVNTYEITAQPCASDNSFTTGITPIGTGGLG